MSSITKILLNKDMEAEEKLEQVVEIVAKVRDVYGNSDSDVPSVKVDTPNGFMDFSYLDSESKVIILRGRAAQIKADAAEFVEQNPGASIQRKVEELLATDRMFANLANGATFDYL